MKWIFAEIKKLSIQKTFEEGYKTYTSLPFLSKYLGDGVLFLWDTKEMSEVAIHNTVVLMDEICKKYPTYLLSKIKEKLSATPPRLRCGIAREIIYSVGNGNDFIGPCINMSARLQKLNSLPFCFSKRGFNLEKFNASFQKSL